MRRRRMSVIAVCAAALSVSPLTAVPAASATPAPNSITWQAPQVVERSVGDPTAISCPSAHHCFIADRSGRVVTVVRGERDGTRKISTDLESDDLESISCPSIHFCAAAGYGAVYLGHGAHWSKSQVGSTSADLHVSCAGASFCAAVDGTQVFTYRHGNWSAATDLASRGATFTDVSCATSAFCVAVDVKYGDQGVLSRAYRWDGTKWTGGTSLSDAVNGMGVGSVSCAARTFCMAAVADEMYRFDGRHWHAAGFGPTDGDRVSCPTDTFCMAVSGSGVDGGATVARYVDGTWSEPRGILRGGDHVGAYVSCSGPKACIAVDVYGDGRQWTGRWQQPSVLDHTVGPNSSGGPWVSCGAPAHCTAVDADGNYFTYRAGTWTAPRRIAVEAVGMASMSCVGAKFCVTVDGSGHTWVYDGTAWHQSARSPLPHDSDRPALVSCGTRAFCMATTGNGLAATFDGHSWSKPAHFSGDRQVLSLSCTRAHFCALTDLDTRGDRLFTYRRGDWQRPLTIPTSSGGPFNVACAGATCLVSNYSPGLDVFRHGGWGGGWQPTPADVLGASCVRARFCVVDEYQSYQIWNGAKLSDPAPLADDDQADDGSISCVAPHFCAAVGLTGAVVGH